MHRFALCPFAPQVPWSNLGGAPVVCELEGIYVLAVPNKDAKQSVRPPPSHPRLFTAVTYLKMLDTVLCA